MTLYQFKLLDLNNQAEATWAMGVLIDIRIEGTLTMSLYRIDNFFSEVHYDQRLNKIVAIRSFTSDIPLQPYLDKINLTELLNIDVIVTYQTALYNAVFINKKFGWDYGTVAFESEKCDNPTDAMMEFNEKSFELEYWIGTLRVIKNGDVTEEEMFDSNVYKEE